MQAAMILAVNDTFQVVGFSRLKPKAIEHSDKSNSVYCPWQPQLNSVYKIFTISFVQLAWTF